MWSLIFLPWKHVEPSSPAKPQHIKSKHKPSNKQTENYANVISVNRQQAYVALSLLQIHLMQIVQKSFNTSVYFLHLYLCHVTCSGRASKCAETCGIEWFTSAYIKPLSIFSASMTPDFCTKAISHTLRRAWARHELTAEPGLRSAKMTKKWCMNVYSLFCVQPRWQRGLLWIGGGRVERLAGFDSRPSGALMC